MSQRPILLLRNQKDKLLPAWDGFCICLNACHVVISREIGIREIMSWQKEGRGPVGRFCYLSPRSDHTGLSHSVSVSLSTRLDPLWPRSKTLLGRVQGTMHQLIPLQHTAIALQSLCRMIRVQMKIVPAAEHVGRHGRRKRPSMLRSSGSSRR